MLVAVWRGRGVEFLSDSNKNDGLSLCIVLDFANKLFSFALANIEYSAIFLKVFECVGDYAFHNGVSD